MSKSNLLILNDKQKIFTSTYIVLSNIEYNIQYFEEYKTKEGKFYDLFVKQIQHLSFR